MAHIKVVRRSMRPEEYTKLRFGWLKRHLYEDKTEITSFTIKEARQTSEMKFEFYDKTPRLLRRGDMYFSPDGTAFIEADVSVPEKYKGKEIRFALKTAAEMIVKVNGKYVGGIDPNRENLILSPYIESDDLHIEITAYNRSKPDDERNPESLSVRGCRQIFEGGYLAIINKDIQSLIFDIEMLLATKNVLDGERYKNIAKEIQGYIKGEYGKAPGTIDPELVKKVLGDEQPITCRFADTLEDGLPAAREYLGKTAESDEDVLSYIAFPQQAEAFFEKRADLRKRTFSYSIKKV